MFISGFLISDKKPARSFDQTKTGAASPSSIVNPHLKKFKTSREVHLQNGDKCEPGQFVVVSDPRYFGVTFVARVEEILTIVDSVADRNKIPDGILLRKANVERSAEPYRMPHIDLLDSWLVSQFSVSYLQLSSPHSNI